MNIKNEMRCGSLKENVASELNENHSSVKSVVAVVLGLWFGLVFLLGTQGAFVGSADSPPLPMFFGFATPFGGFFMRRISDGTHSGRSSSPADSSGSWRRSRRMAVGRLGLPFALRPWRFAGTVRLPGRTRGHGGWIHRAVDRARACSRPIIRGQPPVCDLEYPGDH